ncbi:MAG: ABC transporter permease [Candidatus Binatia bacterium]
MTGLLSRYPGDLRSVSILTLLKSGYTHNRLVIHGVLSIGLGIVLWEIIDRVFNDKDFFTGPDEVFLAYIELFREGSIWEHIRYSALEGVYGFALAASVGVTIGAAIAFSRTLDEMFSPILVGLYATPRSVVAPIFIIWLGLGIASKIGVIFVASFFPIAINTTAGIKNVEGEFRMLGRAFNISRRAMLTRIIVPGSLPFLIAGLRLGYSRAVVTIMVAELFGSEAGLGYMIVHATQVFNIPEMMVGISMLTAWGILGNELLKLVERWATPYKQTLGPA